MTATIYTNANCGQCYLTIKKFDKEHLAYETVRLDQNPAALEKVKNLGYMQAPVVITADGDHWSGFRPDRISTWALREQEMLAAA